MAAGVNDTLLDVGTNAMRAVALYLSIHTATPNTSGSNESTAPRVAASWPASSGGDLTISNKAFTGGASGGPAVCVGLWSGPTLGSGTFYGYQVLTGDQTFNSAGEYTVTGVTFTVTAS